MRRGTSTGVPRFRFCCRSGPAGPSRTPALANQTPTSRTRLIAFGALIFAAVIYGAQFPLSRLAVTTDLTVWDLTALRYLTAGILLLPLFIWFGWRDCCGLGWSRGIRLALAGGVPMMAFLTGGLAFAPAGHGAAIQPGWATVVTFVFAWLLGVSRPRPVIFLGLAIAGAGLFLIAWSGSAKVGPHVVTGYLLFLCGGTLWATFSTLTQRWKIDAFRAVTIVAVLSLAFAPIYVAFLSPRLLTAPLGVVAFHGFNQGVLNMIVGMTIWSWGIRLIGATAANRFGPLIPVFGTLLAIPVLGEIPTSLQILGVVAVVGGLLITSIPQRAR
jgi:drug/metabolite transporter (DMT)-like permease